MSDEMNKKDEPKKPVGDSIITPTGREVYDKGESIVKKMNRERAVFDKDLFFQELYENYLVCVQRHEIRQKPKSRIITHWDESTSFDDFLSDAVENIDRQLDSIKFAKAVNAPKVSATDGDFFLQEAKIDEGSEEVGKKFGVEDYDALYEILRRSKEAIVDVKTGKMEMIVNTKTGRVRVVRSVGQ